MNIKYLLPILLLGVSSCSQGDSYKYQNMVDSKCIFDEKSKFEIYKIREIFECGNNELAINLINSKEKEFNVEDKVSLGAILFDYGLYDMSEKFLEEASKYNNAEAYYRLGYIYLHVENKKNVGKAIILFKKSLEGGYDDSLVNLGEIYLFEQEYKNIKLAKFYFEKALSNNITIAYYGLGEYFLKTGDFKKAEDCFDELIKNNFFDLGYLGYYDLYYNYPDYSGHNIDKAKNFIDLLLRESQDYLVFESASEFYSGNHKYKDLEKSRYYKDLFIKKNPYIVN